MSKETDILNSLSVVFNGLEVAICAQTDWLAEQVRGLFRYLLGRGVDGDDYLLCLRLRKIKDDFFEVEEHAQRREQGSLEYILYHTREWVTSAFIAASPDLLWLHASGTVYDGQALLLPGPAGSGKSTLAARLVERGWFYLADDIVPVAYRSHFILPFPFPPAIRYAPYHEDDDWCTFLEQEKTHIDIPIEQICAEPVSIRCIIFPEYSVDVLGHAAFEPMTAVAATHMLMTQCTHYETRKEETIARLFELARSVPSFRLTYSDPDRAVSHITDELPASESRRYI